MLRFSLLCLLPLVVSVTEQLGNDGIRYYGTSNVRYQQTYPPPLSFPGRSQSITISTTTDTSPLTTKPAPPTADVPKSLISKDNVTTSSGPIYLKRRKPFLLPRRTILGSRPKQQTTQTLAVVDLQPNSFVDTQSPKLPAPQPSLISFYQPSNVSAPNDVIQVTGPQRPIYTTLETSTVDVVSPTLTTVSAQPNASPVAVQPKKKPVSFALKPEGILETVPISLPQSQLILQAKPEINTASAQEQDPQPETESTTISSFSKPNQVSYPINMRPYITFAPLLEPIPVEEPDTTESTASTGSTTETPPKAELVAEPIEIPSMAINFSSVNAANGLPIINTTSQTPTDTEMQPPLLTASKLPLTETETRVITAPRVVIQLITDSQVPLNSESAIYQPDVTSVQLNKTADLRLPAPLLSTLTTPTISEATVQPKTEPAINVTDPNIIVESELVPQLEPEPTAQPEIEPTTQSESEPSTQPELETTTQPTFQSKPNLTTPEQISYTVKITPRGEERIEEYTTVLSFKQRGDAISEPSFTFETPVNATNQTLGTESQLIELVPTQILATSQLPIMTTSPQPEVTTTLQESIVIDNNPPQAASAPQEIIQLIMPPQPSLNVAPQLPVSPAPKPLAVVTPTSRISEEPQKADQPELFSVTEVSDSKSELATSQESKQDARPNPELATHSESETTFEPEVVILSKPYSYPVKLRPKVSFVAVPDSAWKDVALKPQLGVLPPLLPRPKPIREPAYGRHNQSTTQYPITSTTHHVLKVSPIIKPTPAPFISTSNTIWQPNYGRYTLPTTQNPIIEMTQNTTEVPLYNVSTSKRPESSNLDFFCNEGNGYYTVDYECDTYILCQRKKATKFSCPDGLYFNPAAKYNEYPCVYPSEVQCNGSTGKQYTRPAITGTRQCPKQYGLFAINDGDCSKYIMCNIGVATVMNCPAGLVFNPSTESCDWVANVPQCNPRVFKDYTCPDPPVDEYGVATDIIYKYKYRNQCTQYIACQRGYPRLLSCERGLAFDDESQSCISSVYVPNCAPYTA
ncbi:unnamed protein product [Arctia plantaginis]|uniref:Chitin-binding type-2 domain-containing protein n=1 Tax=Arctia plantaginis TaxID=874455 RepID=A0A8S0ZXB6_ARCPL|nr:unnamed protein product [Arctia plantaginis]